ncbi:MAG TPA: Dickkopf N-terminal cysteine-rich domain-containing protein [Polyangiaceae bacterium]|nr:Dickkopf N-terminal cysteine-rich domain-containing protein [Polyangiaceae bacterium]
MKLRVWTLVCLAALASAAACGGSSSDHDNSGTVEPVDQLPTIYTQAYCDALTACAGPLLAVFLPGEDCVTRTLPGFEEELSRIQAAIDAGKVVYHGDKIDACAEEIRMRDCAGFLERESDLCRAALDGTVALDGDCTMDEECSGVAYCDFAAACPGTCKPLEPAGSTCGADSDCASGLVCSGTTQRCVEPAGPGDLCKGGEPDCALGYICAGADDANNTPGNCRSYDEVFNGSDGAACDPVATELCDLGLVCAVDGLDQAGLMASCAAHVTSGKACKIAFPDQCPDDEYCDVPMNMLDGTCKPRPAAGEPCAPGPIDRVGSICAPYARCDSGTCRGLANLGESCSSNDVCYSSNCQGGACVSSSSCE